jgi:hypothetical protein
MHLLFAPPAANAACGLGGTLPSRGGIKQSRAALPHPSPSGEGGEFRYGTRRVGVSNG